jgi:hypothetical protein
MRIVFDSDEVSRKLRRRIRDLRASIDPYRRPPTSFTCSCGFTTTTAKKYIGISRCGRCGADNPTWLEYDYLTHERSEFDSAPVSRTHFRWWSDAPNLTDDRSWRVRLRGIALAGGRDRRRGIKIPPLRGLRRGEK